MGSSDIDRAIVELSRRTGSVVHARDLRMAGITRNAVRRRIEAEWMHELLPRVYGVGPQAHDPSHEMRCMAGVLAGGRGARVDDETAARLLVDWDRGGNEIHVSVPGRAMRTPPKPFVFHRRAPDWSPEDALVIGPIPLTGFAELCMQLASHLDRWQLAHVIACGRYRRLVTLEQLDRHAAASVGTPWVTVLVAAIGLVRARSVGTRGATEDRLLRAALDHGCPEPLVNTRGALGMPHDEPDFVWLPHRLDVEVDGDQHYEPEQAADDAERDAALRAIGVSVMRVWWKHVWRQHTAVAAHILAALQGEPIDLGRFSQRT